jgi:hypothetical protein
LVSWNREATAVTIAARYEDGVFKPLEEVKLTEGTQVEVTSLKRPHRSDPSPFETGRSSVCGPTATTSLMA